jgi:hypothetical protein
VLKRGAKNPLKVERNSNIADGSAVISVSLIPTPWGWALPGNTINTINNKLKNSLDNHCCIPKRQQLFIGDIVFISIILYCTLGNKTKYPLPFVKKLQSHCIFELTGTTKGLYFLTDTGVFCRYNAFVNNMFVNIIVNLVKVIK